MSGMSKSERDDLARLVRRREKLAKAEVDRRASLLKQDFEAQLATVFDPMDAAWREEMEEARRAIKALNEQIAERCREHGIPERFFPRAYIDWAARGESATAGRRVELRRVATARLDAQVKAAKLAVEESSVRVQTELLAGGLRSEEAREFLASM